MSIKIGQGRGKKGDGLHINRETKQRSYGQARHIHPMSNEQLIALLANPNTRNKDVGKIKRICKRRGMC